MSRMHSEFLLVSWLGKKCCGNVNSEMSRFELLWYNMRDFLQHYVCLKMITNKKVKWDDDNLCDTLDTYSNDEYDRKSELPSNTPRPHCEMNDIFGNRV